MNLPIEYTISVAHRRMKRIKMFNSSFKFYANIHLALFFTAIVWFVPTGSTARVIDQLNETFEFMSSQVPPKNCYMLKDTATDASAAQLILILVAALPSYIISYPLFSQYFNEQLQ